jgi:hypothetical protein
LPAIAAGAVFTAAGSGQWFETDVRPGSTTNIVDLTGDDRFVTLDYEPYLNGSNPVPGDWNQVGRHRLLQQRRPGNMVRDFVFFFFEVLSKK